MPSRTTADRQEHFTYYSTYSWSECGNYDDSTGYVKCNACDAVVLDEYSYDEIDMEYHKTGECKRMKEIREYARNLARKMTPVWRCRYCGQWDTEAGTCACPF